MLRYLEDLGRINLLDSICSPLAEKTQNSRRLAEKAQFPTRAFYCAGGPDLYQFLQPLIDVMAVPDLKPLLFETETANNSYSPAIRTFLENQQDRYFTLEQLVSDELLNPLQQKQLLESTSYYVRQEARRLEKNSGFFPENAHKPEDIEDDGFAPMLATLLIMGVNLHTVHVGMFPEEIRMRFVLNDREKTLLYRNTEVDEQFSTPGSPNYRWARKCFDDFPSGPVELIIKGDNSDISSHVVDAVKPDVIFGTGVSINDIKASHPEYPFFVVSNFPFPNSRWGYLLTEDVEMARRTINS